MLKRILAFLICFNITYSPAFCIINDDFAQKTLQGNSSAKNAQMPSIIDDFTENTLNKNLKKKVPINKIIEDKFAQNNKNKNIYSKPKVDFSEQIVATNKKSREVKKAIIASDANIIPIQIRIKKYFSTKHKVDEGDYIEFETLNEVEIKNKIYPSGTTVQARIETISQNKMWGVPTDLVIGNFSINGEGLKGEISKTGANRSLWLYPTVYMATWLFGFGLLLIPIRGGHVKITTKQIYTINHSN